MRYYGRQVKNRHRITDLDTALERIRQLEETLGIGFMVDPRLNLTRMEEELLGLLYACQHIVTREAAYTALFGMHEDPPEQKILDVATSHLRKKLRHLDVTITTVWGRGWYLEPKERAKLDSFVFKPTAGEAVEAA